MHPSGARLFRRGGLLFAAVAVTAVATAAASLWVSLAAIERDPNLLPPGDQSIASADTSINVLLISADAAKGADVADIVTLLHIDADRRDVQLIDIPRELAITGSAAEPRVLADVYTDDGAAATVEAVEQTVGIRVQHVALASLSGTSRLIDLLGGVPVDNPSDAASGGFVFPRGEITLSGDEALAYTREGVAAGEFDPAHRRQLVLTGIVTRLLTGDAMLNPGTARAVLDQLATVVVVDSGLDNLRLIDLVVDLHRKLAVRTPTTIRLPTAGWGTSPSGRRYVVADVPRVAALAQAINTDTVHAWQQRR